MSLWTLRIGIALAVVGLALLSPLGDLLPFDFLSSLVAAWPALAEPAFYRAVPVPVEPSRIVEFVLIGIGLALLGGSLFVRLRK